MNHFKNEYTNSLLWKNNSENAEELSGARKVAFVTLASVGLILWGGPYIDTMWMESHPLQTTVVSKSKRNAYHSSGKKSFGTFRPAKYTIKVLIDGNEKTVDIDKNTWDWITEWQKVTIRDTTGHTWIHYYSM